MRYLIFCTLIFVPQLLLANDNNFTHNTKLSIIGGAPNSNPESWLQYYGLRNNNNGVLITLNMDIENISEVIVTDVNAENNKCNKPHKKELLHLFLKEDSRLKGLSAFINMPCFDGLKTILKLTVTTENKNKYSNTIQLKASVGVFEKHWSSDSMN